MDASSERYGTDYAEGISEVVDPKHKFLSKTAKYIHSLAREKDLLPATGKTVLSGLHLVIFILTALHAISAILSPSHHHWRYCSIECVAS